uniref:NADH-ubiquinone oxidoreductase chain 6 n=1 Tax=Ips sexdentatus TaxID=55985 RepID=A0A343A4X3_9CUCU|nr:NADH dehydrogenase subunit 6 [Ips sexdentatus]AOY39601.1 NADH dehydrogenase subunit 6 [Ips sexdentatus]
MLLIISTLIFFLSWTFIFLNHPLALGSILFLQTILTSLISGALFLNFWYSYILFLIMIGGMLILFIYMTSIASNEKFGMPAYWKILVTLMLLSILIIFYLFNDPMIEKLASMKWNFFWLENSYKTWALTKFFNSPFNQMIIFLMVYLFLTLIMAAKISGKPLGAFRQKK